MGVVAGGYSVERLRVSRALSREFAGQPCVEDYQIVCYTVELTVFGGSRLFDTVRWADRDSSVATDSEHFAAGDCVLSLSLNSWDWQPSKRCAEFRSILGNHWVWKAVRTDSGTRDLERRVG